MASRDFGRQTFEIDSGTRWKLPNVVVFGLLYLAAAAILLWRIGNEPSVPVNWEAYTLRGLIDFIQDPTWDVLRLNGGLMTNSGQSAAVVWPAWLGFKIFGATLLGLRLPIALIVAFSVPLTWAFGRALYSEFVGIIGALLVATSQVFLLYGRTGTNVGMSITPALIGYLLLWRCVKSEETQWPRWLILLQVILVINGYFYSPIRFLWPIALVLLAVEIVLQRGDRRRFLVSFGVTLVWLPLAVTLLRPGPFVSPIKAVEDYYYGRGEQIFNINEFDDGYLAFLRVNSDEERIQLEAESSDNLALRLIRQNATDLTRLLLDQGTRPPNEFYWNPEGRLYPLGLVPFFLIGTVILGVRFLPDPRARLLLALFWGFSLPLLLTSRVHIGRLVFILPLLAIICAIPIGCLIQGIGGTVERPWRRVLAWSLGLVGGIGLVVISVVPSLNYWSEPFPYDRTTLVGDRIDELLGTMDTNQLVYVFGDLGGYEVEGLRIASYEITFRNRIRFVDLVTGERRGSGATTLIYGAIIPLLGDPGEIPDYCANLYLVEPDQLERFREGTEPRGIEFCGAALRIEVLDV